MDQRNLTLTMEEEPHWSQLWDENWEMAMSITDRSSKTCRGEASGGLGRNRESWE